jgi:retinol dehydrogenase 14
VLVNGGTGGIGRATALGLAEVGAHLAITGRDRGRAEAAAREIRAAASGRVEVFVADLSIQAEVRRLAGEVLRCLSRIDVLVNNAGGTGTPGMSPLTGSSAPSRSIISLHSCSLACSWTG